MVLSNAEKQRRFRERLKARADSGVTRDDVLKVARLMWERQRKLEVAAGKSDPGGFDHRLAHWRGKGKASWLDLFPDRGDADYWREDFGPDAELVAKVAAVVRATRLAPD